MNENTNILSNSLKNTKFNLTFHNDFSTTRNCSVACRIFCLIGNCVSSNVNCIVWRDSSRQLNVYFFIMIILCFGVFPYYLTFKWVPRSVSINNSWTFSECGWLDICITVNNLNSHMAFPIKCCLKLTVSCVLLMAFK